MSRWNPWYRSLDCKILMDSTDSGRLMFIWEAKLSDGSVIRQFEDHTWDLLLSNPTVAIPSHLRLSTDIIPRDKVVQFTLVPIALTKKYCPWFDQEGFVFSRPIDPEQEDLLAYWLVDDHVSEGPGIPQLARQVVGVLNRLTNKRELQIISPSGAVMTADNDNQSYEGE